jgi:hypothetical protein
MKCAKLYIIIIFSLFFLSSCQLQNNYNNSQSIPSWYINAKNNDQDFLYGVGSGFDLIEAKNSAIYDASSRLSSTISGQTQIIRQENNHDALEESYQNISAKTNLIKFNNYKLLNSSQIGEKYFIEIAIDRKEFNKTTIKDIKKIYAEIKELDKISKFSNILNRLRNLNEIRNKIAEINFLSDIIQYKIDQRYLNHLNSEGLTIRNKIELFIDNPSSKESQLITKHLNKKNFKIIKQRPKFFKKNQLEIKITSSKSQKNIYDNYITNIVFNIKIKDNNKILSSNVIKISAASLESYKLAEQSAFNKLEQKIIKDGIMNLIGIYQQI